MNNPEQILETQEGTYRLASFVSGGGTTAEALAKKAKTGELGNVETVVFIASKGDIGAIKKAKALGIPVEIVNPKAPLETIQALIKHKVQVVMQNGRLPKTPKEVIEFMKQQGIDGYNQHPGDLREDKNDFGGNEKDKGMYGTRVTAARALYLIASGLSGNDIYTTASVHKLTDEVDGGEVIEANSLHFEEFFTACKEHILYGYDISTQEKILIAFQQILEEKDEKSKLKRFLLNHLIKEVQEKLLDLEHITVQASVRKIIESKTTNTPIETHQSYYAQLIPETHLSILDWAKRVAVKMYPKG